MIPFNKPFLVGDEIKHIANSINSLHWAGDGHYTKLCSKWLEDNLKTKKALLTTSCTSALEMAIILSDIGINDEVIIPSYTFVSTANSVVMRGAKPVFVDVDSRMQMDSDGIEKKITEEKYKELMNEKEKYKNLIDKNNIIEINNVILNELEKDKDHEMKGDWDMEREKDIGIEKQIKS